MRENLNRKVYYVTSLGKYDWIFAYNYNQFLLIIRSRKFLCYLEYHWESSSKYYIIRKHSCSKLVACWCLLITLHRFLRFSRYLIIVIYLKTIRTIRHKTNFFTTSCHEGLLFYYLGLYYSSFNPLSF